MMPPDTPSSPARRPRGERSRAIIMAAAKAVFEDKGYLNARVSDISRAAGSSHGLFYNYFTSKQDVFRQLADEIDREMIRGVAARFDASLDIEAIWTDATRTFFRYFREEARMLRLIDEVARYDEIVRTKRGEHRRREHERLERAIALLQQVDRADTGLEAHVIATAIMSLGWSFAERWLLAGEADAPVEERVGQFMRLMFNLLRFVRIEAPTPAR